MAKKISGDLVIGNALISTNKECITIQQVYQYWHLVDGLLPEGYYTYGNNNSFADFCEEYHFLVKRVGDTMMLNCDIDLIKRYFRIGVPKEIIQVFDFVGDRLNEIETEEAKKDTEGRRKILVNSVLKQ